MKTNELTETADAFLDELCDAAYKQEAHWQDEWDRAAKNIVPAKDHPDFNAWARRAHNNYRSCKSEWDLATTESAEKPEYVDNYYTDVVQARIDGESYKIAVNRNELDEGREFCQRVRFTFSPQENKGSYEVLGSGWQPVELLIHDDAKSHRPYSVVVYLQPEYDQSYDPEQFGRFLSLLANSPFPERMKDLYFYCAQKASTAQRAKANNLCSITRKYEQALKESLTLRTSKDFAELETDYARLVAATAQLYHHNQALQQQLLDAQLTPVASAEPTLPELITLVKYTASKAPKLQGEQ